MGSVNKSESYSFIEDHRRPVVCALLQHKHDVARHDSQLIAGLRDEFKQHSVRFAFQSPESTGDTMVKRHTGQKKTWILQLF